MFSWLWAVGYRRVAAQSGIIVTLTIPENRINPGYLKERNAAKNQVAEAYNPASGKE